MTKDQATQLLQSEVRQGWDTEGFPQPRMVDAKFGSRAVSAILTTKGVVYSIFSQESFPTGRVGKEAAEAAFQRDRKIYAAPIASPIFRRPSATGQAWTSDEGHAVKIILICDETELIVEIADYQRQLMDDGVSDEKREYFRDGFSDPYDRCF